MMFSNEMGSSLLKKAKCGFLLFTDLYSEYSDGSEPPIPGTGSYFNLNQWPTWFECALLWSSNK